MNSCAILLSACRTVLPSPLPWLLDCLVLFLPLALLLLPVLRKSPLARSLWVSVGFLPLAAMPSTMQELLREKREVETIPEAEGREVADIFQSYGLSREECQPVVDALRRRPKAWVDFMMRFELGLEEPDPGRALRSAITIALAYIVGGLVPLSPYILAAEVHSAFLLSIGVTLIALFIFGFVKARFTGAPTLRGALQTLIIGALAAGAAYLIARWIS